MMRLATNFNWKYVIGEVLLIFIGINLAIWFNNWNTSKKTNHNKGVVITKIEEEIENNIKELEVAIKNNQYILDAYTEFKGIYHETTSEVIATPQQLNVLNNKYPDFFRPTDSLTIKSGLFHYKGSTHIILEIPSLTQIAWETTKSISIANEFDYECLYQLESMYNLQGRVQNEVDKAANAIQKREIKELMNVLGFLSQLESHLMKDYEEMLLDIKNCS